jgi:hypothetical protein
MRKHLAPSPAVCRKIIRERRRALCPSARAEYDANPLNRWWINTLWVIGSIDRANGRKPFTHLVSFG